jgi:hypothetical protein
MVAALDIRGRWSHPVRDLVREGYEELCRQLSDDGRQLPDFVEREVSDYLACGDPEQGFAWLTCDVLLRRGSRRMEVVADAWLEQILPRVAHRQWVLTLPWKRRGLLVYKPELVGGLLGVVIDVLSRWYRREVPQGKTGAVTAIHRFDSALRHNLHFHILMPDGAWVRDGDRGLVFRRSRPTTGDVVDLVEQISLACEGWLTAQGYAPEEEEEPLLDDDDTLALFQAASLQDLHAVGPRAGRRVRPPAPAGPQRQLPAWCGAFDGYNLHAGVVIPARDRAGLGRLARYMLRPPLVGPRVERQPDGSVVLTLKRPWANGTTSLRFAPAELVARLIALIPPFREHQVRYHGVFAPNASWRKEIVPRPATEAEPDQRLSKAPPRVRISGPSWSDLLKRCFDVDGWACVLCGGRMRLRAIVIGPPATTRVLSGLRSRGPPAP